VADPNLAAAIIRKLATGTPGKITNEQQAQLAAALTRLGRIDWVGSPNTTPRETPGRTRRHRLDQRPFAHRRRTVTTENVTNYLRALRLSRVEAIRSCRSGRLLEEDAYPLRGTDYAGRARDAAGLCVALRGHQGPR
jgi:hypothetical protein